MHLGDGAYLECGRGLWRCGACLRSRRDPLSRVPLVWQECREPSQLRSRQGPSAGSACSEPSRIIAPTMLASLEDALHWPAVAGACGLPTKRASLPNDPSSAPVDVLTTTRARSPH